MLLHVISVIINNAVKLAYTPNKVHRDKLYSNRINPIITSPGAGIILFGDKTGLGRSSAFDRINVRRLFIFLEKAIAAAATPKRVREGPRPKKKRHYKSEYRSKNII